MTGLPPDVQPALEFLRLVKSRDQAERVIEAREGVYLACPSPAGELARDAAYDVMEKFLSGRDSCPNAPAPLSTEGAV